VLPAPHRLRRRRDFGVATRRGRRAGSATVVAHLALPGEPQPGLAGAHPRGPVAEGAAPAAATESTSVPDPARVGFVVGGAVGPAVVRNRVRRRLRHLTVDHLRRLPDGTLLVLRALPAAAGATSGQLAADLNRVLERLVPRPRPPAPGADLPV
jgi:ribonuclease P protein component